MHQLGVAFHQYHIQIVPTSYQALSENPVDLHQYSVYERSIQVWSASLSLFYSYLLILFFLASSDFISQRCVFFEWQSNSEIPRASVYLRFLSGNCNDGGTSRRVFWIFNKSVCYCGRNNNSAWAFEYWNPYLCENFDWKERLNKAE